jgi:hypothetical protein
MRLKSSIPVLLFALTVRPLAGGDVDDFLAGVQKTQAYNAAAFRSFFAGTKPMTAFQVRDRFGMPHKYGPLEGRETGKRLSPYRAWWYYELGPVEAIEVMVVDGKVMGVLRRHGRDTEVIRAPPRPAGKQG